MQSKLLLLMALPVIVLTQRSQYSMTKLMTQLILYLALAYNADCLVTGRCKLWAWIMVLLPVVQTIGYLFFVPRLGLRSPVQVPAFRKPMTSTDDDTAVLRASTTTNA